MALAAGHGSLTTVTVLERTREAVEEAANLGGWRQKCFRLLGRAVTLFVRDGDLSFGLHQWISTTVFEEARRALRKLFE